MDKVAGIQAALAAGTYNVPASAVASKLVDCHAGRGQESIEVQTGGTGCVRPQKRSTRRWSRLAGAARSSGVCEQGKESGQCRSLRAPGASGAEGTGGGGLAGAGPAGCRPAGGTGTFCQALNRDLADAGRAGATVLARQAREAQGIWRSLPGCWRRRGPTECDEPAARVARGTAWSTANRRSRDWARTESGHGDN